MNIAAFVFGFLIAFWIVAMIWALEREQRIWKDSVKEKDLERARVMHNEWDAGYEAGKKDAERKLLNASWTTPPIKAPKPKTKKQKKRASLRKMEETREKAWEVGYLNGKHEAWCRVEAMLEPNAVRPSATEPYPLHEVWKMRRRMPLRLAKARNAGWKTGYGAGQSDAWSELRTLQDLAISGKIEEKRPTFSDPALSTAWAHALIFRSWVMENTHKKEAPPNGQTEKLEPRPDAGTLVGDQPL